MLSCWSCLDYIPPEIKWIRSTVKNEDGKIVPIEFSKRWEVVSVSKVYQDPPRGNDRISTRNDTEHVCVTFRGVDRICDMPANWPYRVYTSDGE